MIWTRQAVGIADVQDSLRLQKRSLVPGKSLTNLGIAQRWYYLRSRRRRGPGRAVDTGEALDQDPGKGEGMAGRSVGKPNSEHNRTRCWTPTGPHRAK